MKKVLITGCSSGFGLATANLFHDRGWEVHATMRVSRAGILPASDHLHIYSLDVTRAESIRHVVESIGPVDVLVNNAGIGVLAPLEGTPMQVIHQVYETNALATIAMTQAVLPLMRQRRTGVVVNVSSSVALIPVPLVSVYSGSKAAVNAFTESLAHELAPFGIRVRLILPGRAPGTSFGENAKRLLPQGIPAAYADYASELFEKRSTARGEPLTQVEDVAEAVWRAATDVTAPMKIAAGPDAAAMMAAA
jgi:NAD(P)-dependent dehydrogenase (short-subunit alcohol dehydrogenase family)